MGWWVDYFDSSKRYGAPKITELLKQEGKCISERLVGEIMSENGWRSCVSKKFRVCTTDSNHPFDIAPNTLNQKFHVLEPNSVWVTDITYVPCREGRLYLASVMDLYTRKIAGWRLADRMTTDLVLNALEMAYTSHRPAKGLLHHSDRGSQYASEAYRQRLETYGMKASMSRKGNCYDNACIESWHSLLKKEFIYCTKFKTKAQAQQKMFEYIELFYNRKRIHGSLGYVSPIRFEENYYKNLKRMA
ncbi:IS3 family transposase [Cohnella lubricantis]|uniref:IS3 family transposase n=1 Tax=Cohnella lubricantis TaxID=2163172 RepID=A0A841TM12_9BACL|nr:IS3 family transposase [Cohnella lubricantis]MBB6679571.1 IS3 family transposase [Cohnella lubricantis]MBP2120583.1 transposase InsO family protein [Cohnella lubricantis]